MLGTLPEASTADSKASCSPPRAVLAVVFLQKEWPWGSQGAEILLPSPEETGLAEGRGTGSRGWALRVLLKGDASYSCAQPCWWALSSSEAVSPCAPFWGKSREREWTHHVSPSTAGCPSSPRWLSDDSTTPLHNNKNQYSVLWNPTFLALPGRVESLSLIQTVWNLRVNNQFSGCGKTHFSNLYQTHFVTRKSHPELQTNI